MVSLGNKVRTLSCTWPHSATDSTDLPSTGTVCGIGRDTRYGDLGAQASPAWRWRTSSGEEKTFWLGMQTWCDAFIATESTLQRRAKKTSVHVDSAGSCALHVQSESQLCKLYLLRASFFLVKDPADTLHLLKTPLPNNHHVSMNVQCQAP